VRSSDLIVASALVVITLALLPLWSRWAYATFDRELALADRLHVRWHDYLLVVLIAVVVVVCVKLVGIVMIAAFLVIPPAAARLVTRTFTSMTLVAIVLGVGSSIVGLRISAYYDSPSGATIILVQAAVFFAALVVNMLRGRAASPVV
jgi:zinc transport system permease protein